jgi:hypothetical protein
MPIDTVLAYTILNTPVVSTFTTEKEKEKGRKKIKIAVPMNP